MNTISITSEWTFQLEPGFEHRRDAGDLLLWKGARTIYASVFQTSNADAEEAIAKLLEGRKVTPGQTFDRIEPGLVGHAYLLREKRDGREYWGLNTWTAARGSVACVTFYFPELSELDWAVSRWNTVHCGPCERYVN